MGAQLWVLRAGREAMFADEWRNGGFVALDEEFEAGDLVAVGETALLAKVGGPCQRIYANQLIAFAFAIAVGDIVVVPQLPKRRTYLVGEVVGGYEHVSPYPPSGPHRRRVRWLGEFDREGLSREAMKTLGSLQALFRPSKVEVELRRLVNALQPQSGAADNDAPRPAPAASSAPLSSPPSTRGSAAQPFRSPFADDRTLM